MLTRIGGVALLLAMAARYFLEPSTRFTEGFRDGFTGFLFGVAIAIMLLAIRIKTRQKGSL